MKKNLILLFIATLLFAGCASDYVILPSETGIILTADTSVRLMGNEITFTVKDIDGNDLTADCKFTVNDNSIEGNTFTSPTAGRFEVKADYFGIISEPLSIRFHDGSEVNFVKRVLIEDYTGTWCGYCTRMAHAIELVKAQTDEPLGTAVAVAIHRPSSTVGSLNYDPYNFMPAQEVEELLSTSGYPKGYLNRMTLWTTPEDTNISQPIALTQGENPKIGLALNPTVENGNITLDVDVMFGKQFSNLRLVVYVLENGLIYDQANYYQNLYGGAHKLIDFEHNHVLRESLTPMLGEAITGSTSIRDTYRRTFNVPVPANIANAANIEFVAFVVDANNNALNVRKAHPGETQEFEEL